MVSEESLTELYLSCIEDLVEVGGVLYWASTLNSAGYTTPKGYIQVRLRGRLYLAHRLVYLIHHRYLPDLVDHIDRNPRNNHIDNLRSADKRINAINTGLPSNNTSGIKGVSWHKAGSMWTAQIKDKGRKIHLGSYKRLEDAISARVQAEEELWSDVR